MGNRKDEHVIYVKDLLFAVLYRWRTVLLIAIVLALALGSYRFVSLRNTEDNTKAHEEQTDYEHQKQILALEITRLEDRIDTFSTYVANSPFMTLNPHKVFVNELHIYLEPLQTAATPGDSLTDPADALLGAYRTMLLSNETLSTFAVALGAEGMNMEFIVDVTTDTSANILTMVVRQADQENTESVLDVMQTEIDNAHNSISQVMGEHKVSVLGSSVSLRNDADLALIQTQKNEELVNLKKNLEARTAEQSALVAPTPRPSAEEPILMPVIKFALIGTLLGTIVVAILIIFSHLARNKVYSRRTLQDLTDIHMIGCIPGNKKRFFIDRWIRRLEGRCVESPETQSALIAARICNLCSTEDKLLLTGSGNAEARLPVLNALEAAGCTVIASGDLLCSAETVKALKDCTAVILLEQCGKSRYNWVKETTEQVKATGKSVLGCVLIDG